MGDYMFMLETHLNSDQSRVVSLVQTAAMEAGVNLFLSGGAVRDMLGGYPIRDLDFTVEGNALKLAKSIAQMEPGIEFLPGDDNRKVANLVFPSGVHVEIGMARSEKYVKPGGKPQVTPATIHEHLRGRDFTMNALALSLNRASRGLLLDPTNGQSDLSRKELRATGNYTLYDDPVRLLRLLRFKTRFDYTIAERTQMQYDNARAAGVEKYITPAALSSELISIARETKAGEVVDALEKEGLLKLFSPALAGAKLNSAGFAKLQKARQLLPFGFDAPIDETSLFLYLLTEKLTPKERTGLIESSGLDRDTADGFQKLEARAKKVEKDAASAKLNKPSQVYRVLSQVPGELLLFLLVKSQQRVVLDRIKNYLQKYVPAAQEVTNEMVVEAGGKPGTPKFDKQKTEMIYKRLDARPKKPPVEVPPAEEGAPAVPAPAPVEMKR